MTPVRLFAETSRAPLAPFFSRSSTCPAISAPQASIVSEVR